MRNLTTRMALQITLVIFLVISVSGVLTFDRVSDTVEANTEIRFAETVERGALQAQSRMDAAEDRLLAAASILAAGPEFVDRFGRGAPPSEPPPPRGVRDVFSRALPPAASLLLYDVQGRLVGAPESQPPTPPIVQEALRGGPARGLRIRMAR